MGGHTLPLWALRNLSEGGKGQGPVGHLDEKERILAGVPQDLEHQKVKGLILGQRHVPGLQFITGPSWGVFSMATS